MSESKVEMPRAEEEARKMRASLYFFVAEDIADIQRRTLLAAAEMVCWCCNSDHADKYPLDPSGCYHVNENELTNGWVACEGAKLRAVAERLAEQVGRE